MPVVRMRGKAWVVDARNLRMSGEEGGERPGVVVLGADPQGERLDSAGEQESAVRIEAAAVEVERPAHPVDQFRAAHDGSGDDVGMPAQVLGRAVDGQVESG